MISQERGLKKFRAHEPKPAPYSGNPVRCARCGERLVWDAMVWYPDAWYALGPMWRHVDNYIAVHRKEPPMDQLIVTLDGKDHKIGQGEHTICYLPVPHGSTREEGAKECKVCFAPEHDLAPVEVEPEPEPEKPAKKATKADAKA